MKGIREPLDSLPTHMTEIFYLNRLVMCVILIKERIPDCECTAIPEEVLAEWETEHRAKLLKCSRLTSLSFEDFMRGSDTPHAGAVAAVDTFVQSIRQGLVENDPVKYVTDQAIEDVRKARTEIERCETRLICY